jgi:hypothetical protein
MPAPATTIRGSSIASSVRFRFGLLLASMSLVHGQRAAPVTTSTNKTVHAGLMSATGLGDDLAKP